MTLRISPYRYLIDERRLADDLIAVGLVVRAQDPYGAFHEVDLAAIDEASLRKWMRAAGGQNLVAENLVCKLMRHGS